MTFCHNYFFFVSQFHVKYAYAVSKTVTSFMKFQKNCHQFHVQFQKKLSLLSLVVVKPSVILQKKKHDYQVWIWKLAKKLFFELQNFETHAVFFFCNIFRTFFCFLKLFLKFAVLNRFFMQYFFSFFPNLQHYSGFYQTQMKLTTVSLKLFETICNCHSFTETGWKK